MAFDDSFQDMAKTKSSNDFTNNQEKVINCRCSIDDICTKCTNRCKGITLCTKFIKRSNQKSAFQIHYSAKLELEYYKVINF